MSSSPRVNIAVLSAGRDKAYALGLASGLLEKRIPFEFLGSDLVDSTFLHDSPLVTFRNLRGDQSEDASLHRKGVRVLRYYRNLLTYAVKAKPTLFHILWNNKFEWFDRTLLTLFYRLCGRVLVFTAHNVNIGNRDGNDSALNRLTLKIQYRLVHHVFVHTQQMADALQKEFCVPKEKITVIPFGMDRLPDTTLTREAARAKLGLNPQEKVLLFFGNIAPYKGLEYLIQSMGELAADGQSYKLLVAGHLKCTPEYWKGIEEATAKLGLDSSVSFRIAWIPDEETEWYFKAADVLVLPYTYIFQSGVLFLGYSFGLPVLAADVGSLREDIVEGKTGFVFRPRDPKDMARAIRTFFDSDLYRDLAQRRPQIRAFASERHSWSKVAELIEDVYTRLIQPNHR